MVNNQIMRITQALNHQIRIQILYYLVQHKSSNVNNLVQQFNISQPAVSRHLRILNEAQLVVNHQLKQEKFYKLADSHVKEILDVMQGHVTENQKS